MSYIDKTTGAGEAGALPHGGPGGQRLRVGAAAAELEGQRPSSRDSPTRSGKVGRYLMDTVGSSMSAMVPALSGMPHYNSDGYGNHLYVPWWMWDRHKELNFARGYHIECGGGYGMPGIGSFTGVVNRTEGYGVRDEAGDPRRVRHQRQPVRPRRDDPERAVVLRDRSGGEGQVGHPGAALPLAVERSRAEPGASHAGHLPPDPRGDGGPDQRAAARRSWRPRRAPTSGLGAAPGQQAPQTGQAGPQTGQTNAPAGQPTTAPDGQTRREPDGAEQPHGRRSRAAAPSSTRSARCAWATIRRRAR